MHNKEAVVKEVEVASMSKDPVMPTRESSSWKSLRINNTDANSDPKIYCSNVITTSKYTILNFIPLFLLINLNPVTKFANFYFVIVAILQTIKSITITNGSPTSLPPLVFVLCVQALSDAKEDYARHKADAEANASSVLIFNKQKKEFQKKTWADIKVGDILKIMDKEIFPADMLFLRGSDNKRPRSCFVNTKSMDGETDNKYRRALEATAGSATDIKLNSNEEIANLDGIIECETPNNKTNDFSGALYDLNRNNLGNITCESVLMRGCTLRNTDWVYGVVVTTGKMCKIEFRESQSNLCGDKNAKVPSINKLINREIVVLVLLLFTICLWLAIGNAVWDVSTGNISWYLQTPTESGVEAFVRVFFTAFLLNFQFIPVSLYVSMTLVYRFQAYFMQNDLEMYYADEDEPLRISTATLNDELGQVSYVFSDKTGTLTSNLMEFRKLCIGGISYGTGVTEIGIARMKAMGQSTVEAEKILALDAAKPRRRGADIYCNFSDGCDNDQSRTLFADITKSDRQATLIKEFCLNMALNHTVFVETKPDGLKELSASSPDEQAFVSAAMHFGFIFKKRDLEEGTATIELVEGGKRVEVEVEILTVLEYTNFRKRMSIIVSFPDNRIVLYTKGADNVVYERLRTNEDSVISKKTASTVVSWAEDALRTMVFAYRQISHGEYEIWRKKLQDALSNDVEVAKRKEGKIPNAIDDCYEEMEKNLILQGASAIEDKLQEGVPSTLAKLSDAGVKVWMITGDKVGTAKNIALACSLLKDESEMEWLDITTETFDRNNPHWKEDETLANLKGDLLQQTEQRLREINDPSKIADILKSITNKCPGLGLAQEVFKKAHSRMINNENVKPVGLIIDEKIIDFALMACKKELLDISQRCSGVVCCRARKDQKASMVKLIKEGVPGTITLGIGDGANDVEMIKMANVGVGVIGKEGQQAVNNADYAIGRFRFLGNLLLVHGRYNYIRISNLTCYMFFKNIMLTLVQFWFTCYSGYSGQKFYSELGSQFYNTLYTSFLIVIYGVTDRDMLYQWCLKYPKLYTPGSRQEYFSRQVFWSWMIYALMTSMIIYFLPQYGMRFYGGPELSETIGIWNLGLVTFSCCVLVANLKVYAISNLVNPFIVFVHIISFGSWCFVMWWISFNYEIYPDTFNSITELFSEEVVWASFVLPVAAILLIDFSYFAIKSVFFTSYRQCVREVMLLKLRETLLEQETSRDSSKSISSVVVQVTGSVLPKEAPTESDVSDPKKSASVLDSPAKALRRPTYLGQSQDEASAKSLGKIVAGKEGLRPPSIRKAPEIVKRDTIKISDVEEQKAIDKEY